MAKRVYFCFHYQDVIDFRANVVRNHWLTKPDREVAGFFDASLWESAQKQGDVAIKRLINLSGRVKSGQWWSDQNRPTDIARNTVLLS
jgi:hypothetical protein